MKEFFEALYALFAFRRYTSFDRWFEIGCGVLAWLNVVIVIWGIWKK